MKRHLTGIVCAALASVGGSAVISLVDNTASSMLGEDSLIDFADAPAMIDVAGNLLVESDATQSQATPSFTMPGFSDTDSQSGTDRAAAHRVVWQGVDRSSLVGAVIAHRQQTAVGTTKHDIWIVRLGSYIAALTTGG